MKNIVLIKKIILLATLASFVGCIDDDLAGVGDLPDSTGPTPFFTSINVASSEFNCSEVLLEADYNYQVEAGTNLGVNGTEFLWTVDPSDNIGFINSELPILEIKIDALRADVIAFEDEVADLEFDIPCEEDPARVVILESQLVEAERLLDSVKTAFSSQTSVLAEIADLEKQIDSLPAGTANDRNVIINFPDFGTYDVNLEVTDNLGVSSVVTQRLIISEAVPSIPVPVIGEPSFEDNSLFDGTGDGRDSWRAPNKPDWQPGPGTSDIFQINNRATQKDLPDGVQAAKFPSSGDRIGYQEIEVTPDVNFLISYAYEFDGSDGDGSATISFLVAKGGAQNLAEAMSEDFLIASKIVNNEGTADGVFSRSALGFNSGDSESVILLLFSQGVETRVDDVKIVVNQ